MVFLRLNTVILTVGTLFDFQMAKNTRSFSIPPPVSLRLQGFDLL